MSRLVTRIRAVYDWRRPLTGLTSMLLMEVGDVAMLRRMLRGSRARRRAAGTGAGAADAAADGGACGARGWRRGMMPWLAGPSGLGVPAVLSSGGRRTMPTLDRERAHARRARQGEDRSEPGPRSGRRADGRHLAEDHLGPWVCRRILA